MPDVNSDGTVKILKPEVRRFDIGQVTAIVKTFLRDQYLHRCLSSLREGYPEIKIIIIDDNKETKQRKLETAKYNIERYITLPFNSGLSKARNVGIEAAVTPYVLIGDDDFFYPKDDGLGKLVQLMDVADIAAGCIPETSYEGTFQLTNDDGIKYNKITREYKTYQDIRYQEADLVLNFFIGKTNLLKKVKWDERIKITYEHADFFLTAKSKFLRTVFCPDVKIQHHDSEIDAVIPKEYLDYRRRSDIEKKIFFEKWKFSYVRDMNNIKLEL